MPGIDLGEAGLPREFTSGGLPNTAIARIRVQPDVTLKEQFHNLVEEIWIRISEFGRTPLSTGT